VRQLDADDLDAEHVQRRLRLVLDLLPQVLADLQTFERCLVELAERAAGFSRRRQHRVERSRSFEAFGWWRLSILLRQHRPEPGEGVAPSLLAQGQIQPLQRLLHRLMGGETGPFMASGLHRLLRLLQIPQGLIHPVRRSIGLGQHGEC
jgi:hypothetical protein